MKLLIAMGLYILGALALGILASTMRYVANPNVWPGEVIAYGLGTTGFLIGALFAVIGFFTLLSAIKETFPGLLKAGSREESERATALKEESVAE